MADIRPFNALRPLSERADDVASVPYDVVNTDEARALAANKPLSFLHVSRPEIDLPPDTDIYSDQVYRKALENFETLIRDCPLETGMLPVFTSIVWSWATTNRLAWWQPVRLMNTIRI